MTAPWWRVSPVVDRVLAELIWLHPTTAAFFRSVAAEDAAEDSAEEVVEEVVSAPRAA